MTSSTAAEWENCFILRAATLVFVEGISWWCRHITGVCFMWQNVKIPKYSYFYSTKAITYGALLRMKFIFLVICTLLCRFNHYKTTLYKNLCGFVAACAHIYLSFHCCIKPLTFVICTQELSLTLEMTAVNINLNICIFAYQFDWLSLLPHKGKCLEPFYFQNIFRSEITTLHMWILDALYYLSITKLDFICGVSCGFYLSWESSQCVNISLS